METTEMNFETVRAETAFASLLHFKSTCLRTQSENVFRAIAPNIQTKSINFELLSLSGASGEKVFRIFVII